MSRANDDRIMKLEEENEALKNEIKKIAKIITKEQEEVLKKLAHDEIMDEVMGDYMRYGSGSES